MSVVYVIELTDGSLYVGRTNLTRKQRIHNHQMGHKSARVVRRIGVLRQRDDLIPDYWNQELTYEESHVAERELAEHLKKKGHIVYGGH